MYLLLCIVNEKQMIIREIYCGFRPTDVTPKTTDVLKWNSK